MQPLSSDDPPCMGPYRLLGRLGAGGMGRVYLADRDGETVAVKVVRPELAELGDFRRRFAREVRVARRVDGRWTAPVLDADTEADVPWVATAYVPGPTLHAVVRGDFGPLPSASAHVLANRMGLALRAIHDAGLVHRDLKPSNVLLTVDGPRVIDFGIAHVLDSTADSLHTPSGTLLGSPEFMSPEQVRGDAVSPASDVFSLGCVLAYAATGRSPFDAADRGTHAVLFHIANEEPELADVPEALIDLVTDCLAKEPDDRPAVDDVIRLTRHAPSGAWLPTALLDRLDRAAARPLPRSPHRLDVTAPAPDVTGVQAVFPDFPEPAAVPPTRPDPLDIPEARIRPPHVRPAAGAPSARRWRGRTVLALTAAVLAVGTAVYAAPPMVSAVLGRPADSSPASGPGPEGEGVDGADLPGPELANAAGGETFGGSWTSLLDEGDPLFMMRLDIPADPRRGDKVPFVVGRSDFLCSGEARVTSSKRHSLTVGDARTEHVASGSEKTAPCLPRHVTLSDAASSQVMWRASEDEYVQIDRTSPAGTTVPGALVGKWRLADEVVEVVRGRAGEQVVTGTDRSDGCTWSAALMAIAPGTSGTSRAGEIAVAPALGTEPGCTPPGAAYRFYRDGDTLVRYRTDKAGEKRLTRAG
ncbi:protein kinase [Streptomyces sp. NPDC050400]|uniref:serine/threonine-protein kinase n=1 Tax=Streptomyces sp. NPDC050400 TaxID=3365610 RepID=UPI00379904D2